MKLTIELVPQPCWYSNLRNQIEQYDWDKLRKQVYADYNHQCGICERTSKTLHCHEIWHYDDRAHIQRLEGFIALCPMCHHCKHIGYAGILSEQGKLDFQRVIDHFCRVNELVNDPKSRSGSLLVIQVLQSYEEVSGNRFGSE